MSVTRVTVVADVTEKPITSPAVSVVVDQVPKLEIWDDDADESVGQADAQILSAFVGG